MIRVDNGPEFISHKLTLAYIQPGKPTNGSMITTTLDLINPLDTDHLWICYLNRKPLVLITPKSGEAYNFTDVLKSHDIKISMDGKRRCGDWESPDNVMVERLWRSLKHEEVYLKAYDSVADARRSIGIYL